MPRAIFDIQNLTHTERFGSVLAELLRPGDVVGLSGDLGAGKTTLAGAVAHGLGVPAEEPVPSPTFTLINEHKGRMPVYHMDLFRLGAPDELYELGLWEYYEGEGVCLVEWCARFDDLWPDRALVLEIALLEAESRRISAWGEGRGGDLVLSLRERAAELE